MKFCKRLLLATTAVSLTLLLSVAGSAQAQQRCQTDGQERKVHLHLSDPQLPEELVCEVIDEFTDRYSEQLAQWTIMLSLFSINMVAIIPIPAAARTLVSALIVQPAPTGRNVVALIA